MAEQEHTHTNRLIDETSPYLLQHAHNPVDWYPWGEEALQKARQEDRPILLSIGYSACHWCHVMERESFENEEIARLMNDNFVCIKVDREERPDLDAIYMQAVQGMTGQGGWPMTMFLTPDGRPFFGGTYFPPRDRRYGGQVMPGFPRILLSIATTFTQQRTEVEEQASQVADYLQQRSNAPLTTKRTQSEPESNPLNLFNRAYTALAEDFDAVHGGFRGAPKFPNSLSLELLMRIHLHRQKQELGATSVQVSELEIVESTLRHMAAGGIYDQLGGGFHRYSVDAEWLVPHFEKMLYDNALLSRCYLYAYLVTGNAFYRRVVEETLDYVVREMTDVQGGFYSTQDADSEGEEGKFFTWTVDEINRLLPEQDARLFIHYYSVTPGGNFEGKNILYINQEAESVANDAGVSLDALQESLERSRATLFQAREQRIKPGRDEKVLTSWNGLMLRSFAEAARYLKRADYLQVAQRNANFLLTQLRDEHGRLLRTWKDGRAKLKGYLEDYAFLADGLLSLYEASFETRWFSEVRALIEQSIPLFADSTNGGFFDTGSDAETLVSRPKDIMDNATPAGNNVAAAALLRLAALSGEIAYRERAESYLLPMGDVMVQHPQAFGQALCALDFALSTVKEIAISGAAEQKETQELLEVVNTRFLPNSVVASGDPNDSEASKAITLLEGRSLKDGRATAYVCQHFVCQAPVTTADELEAAINR